MTNNFRSKTEYSRNIDAYLVELETLTNRRIERGELLSLEETERIALEGRMLKRLPTHAITLEFRRLATPRLRELALELDRSNPSGVYIWTPRTGVCGLLPPVPISEFNFGFPFELNADGMLKLVTADLADSLVVDLEDSNGRRTAQLELSGPNWGHVAMDGFEQAT